MAVTTPPVWFTPHTAGGLGGRLSTLFLFPLTIILYDIMAFLSILFIIFYVLFWQLCVFYQRSSSCSLGTAPEPAHKTCMV
nr:MAG TPA: hypothetical protein [Caudoviricetes sp.]